jgi:hypothetical protein
VTKLCDVKSNLTGVEQQDLIRVHKKTCILSKGIVYFICRFEVKVIVDSADLRFELWFGGQKFNRNHEPLSIDWDEEGSKAKAT